MESIDRLREWASVEVPYKYGHQLIAIADAIEQEHKQTLHDAVNKAHADGERNAMRQERSASEDYRRGHNDGYLEAMGKAEDNERFRREAEPFCDRLKAAVDEREDVTLWGVDYTPLPTDADGVPIHVGDVMENIVCPPVHREVTGVGVECFYGWDEGNGRYSQFGANCYRHHRIQTVEDVLREFAAKLCIRDGFPTATEETFAEYAAKLTLRGDE